MKTSKIKLGLLTAAIVPFLMACPKKRNVTPPEPDTETQSSVDISFANMIISDIDMMCGFGAEGDQSPDFYLPRPGEPSNSNVQAIVDPSNGQLVINYSYVNCLDGKLRNGAVFLRYPGQILDNTNNAIYYHKYQFKRELSLSDYRVDGWVINTSPSVACKIYNNQTSSVLNPAKEKLSWTIEGKFEFNHPSDPSKNMVWTGKLTKTLANTSDPNVYDPNRLMAINWALAKVEYHGTVSGVTSGNVPFKMEINAANPLTRDFTCFSDVIGGVTNTPPPATTWKKEFHPFKSGIVSLTTGDKYPRQIYYGNEGNPELTLQCDNSGQVLIQGNSYKIDF